MMKMTLRTKLVFGGIILVLIPVMTVGLFSIFKASKALESSSEREVLAISRGIAGEAQLALLEEIKVVEELSVGNTPIDVATQVAKSGDNKLAGVVEKLDRKLASAMKQIGKDYESIFVADTKGTIYSDGNEGSYKGISISDRDYFNAAKNGKANVGKAVKSKKTGNPIIPVCAPIYSQSGEVVGTMAALMKIDYFLNKVANTKAGQTGNTFIADSDGMCIAHSKRDLILASTIKDFGLGAIAERLRSRQEGIEPYTAEGKERLAGFTPVQLTGWSVIATQEKDELLSPVRAIRDGILIIAIALLVCCSIGATIASGIIIKPISKVIDGLSEAAEQVAAASSEVSSASQQLAEGASEQAASLEETSSSLEEMSSMTKQNASNANEANQLMREAKSVVERANQSMSGLTASMTEISRASEETQKIVKTIDEIAFQTNLLALNAAVEAARAGDAGAGFAVVADEVRNLAIRAAEAAKNTANLIEGTVKRVKDGSGMVSKTGEEFNLVASKVTKSGELVSEIAAASTEQSQGIDQVNTATSQVDKVTQQNAANAEESAAASEEMNAQAEHMKEFVAELISLVGGTGNGRKTDGKKRKKQSVPEHQSYSPVRSMNSSSSPAGRQVIQAMDKSGRRATNGSTGIVARPSPRQVIPLDEKDLEDF